MKLGTPFKPQLVLDTTIEKTLYHNDSVLVEPKIDGIRGVVHKNGHDIKIFTRTGKDYTEKFSKLVPIIQKLPTDKLILDGEIAVFRANKSTTSNDVLRTERGNNEKLTFCAFDVLQVDDTFLFKQALLVRKYTLSTIPSSPNLMVVPFKELDTKAKIYDFYRTVLKAGFEGLVMKNPYSAYSFKRTYDWGRVKPLQTIDGKIIDKKERKDGSGFIYTVAYEGNISGTISDINDLPLNSYIEVTYEKLLQNGDDFKLRFPRLLRVRHDKTDTSH